MRDGNWRLQRRVPRRYAGIESRVKIDLSLHTDSRAMAEQKAAVVWDQLIEAWEARLAGDTTDAEARFEAAKEIAAKRGFRFMPAAKVARLPLPEILARVDSVVDSRGRVDRVAADAVLGAAQPPKLTVSRALDRFYAIEAARLLGKSKDQIRRHRAPRLKATRNFITVIGDKPLAEVTTRDLFAFRSWWGERALSGEVTTATANKDFAYLLAMWRAVARANEIRLSFATEKLMMDPGKKNTRPPFSKEWITDNLIPGLGGLNRQARGIVLVMVNTGARPSEIAGLRGERIALNDPVPHIIIAPDGRALKTYTSERPIPLVGVSLDAMRENPEGFPDYFDKPGLSNTINKYFTENGLRETPKHSLYSLRHSFEDRLLQAGVDERVRRDLLGHSLKRERYGEGGGLAHKRDLLLKVALQDRTRPAASQPSAGRAR